MAELARVSGHLTPSSLAAQLARLDRPGVPILIYGLKPLFEDEIAAELADLPSRDLRLLGAGDELDL